MIGSIAGIALDTVVAALAGQVVDDDMNGAALTLLLERHRFQVLRHVG